MSSLAVLGSTLAAQVKENPGAISGLELAHEAGELDAFSPGLGGQTLDVLLLDLDALGPAPLEAIRRLQKESRPSVTVVAYAFARRELVQQLQQQLEGVRLLRKPMDLGQLRLTVLGQIVRGIFGQGGPAPVSPPAPPARRMDVAPVAPGKEVTVPPKRFSAEQLGRLQEMRSSVQCECPNHVSVLVQSLLAFEEYSRTCEDRNAADAAMHRQLFQNTGRARAIMEDALAALVKFENIQL